MLKRLMAMLGDDRDARTARPDPKVATAVLLVEAASMDGGVGSDEEGRLAALLRSRFGLSEAEAAELVEAAHAESALSVQLHGMAQVLRDHLSEPDRIATLEMMWEVVYADGELHHLEANLLRRVAGLLYVSDRDSGLARQRALARLGRSADGTDQG